MSLKLAQSLNPSNRDFKLPPVADEIYALLGYYAAHLQDCGIQEEILFSWIS